MAEGFTMAKEYRVVGDRFVIRMPFRVRGIWKARIRDKLADSVVKVSSRLAKKQHADRFFQRWCEERLKKESGTAAVARRFDIAFEEFLSLKTLRPRTREEYEACFRGVYTPAFGELLVHEVDVECMERFLKDLESKRKLAPRTRQKHLTYLRSFFRWARRRRYCLEDPTDGLKVGRAAKRLGIALTLDEARKLVRACREEAKVKVKYSNRRTSTQTVRPPAHLFLAVFIALHTGLRRGNITGLRWKQVDLGKAKFTFPAEEMKANADLEIPIHPELLEVLNARLAGLGKFDPKAPVVGIDVYSLKKSFRWALKQAALPYAGDRRVRFHDLRHTVSTWLAVRYPQAIKDAILGHAPRGVSGAYNHVGFDDLKSAIAAMPRLLVAEIAPAVYRQS